MKDAIISEKIVRIKSLIKEGIDIGENVKTKNEGNAEKLKHLLHDAENICSRCVDNKILSDLQPKNCKKEWENAAVRFKGLSLIKIKTFLASRFYQEGV